MHDLDRTAMEFEWESDEYGDGEYENGYEYGHRTYQGENGYEREYEGPLSDAEEMELAVDLLEVTSDEELDQFLGKLISKAGGAIRNFAKSKAGKALGGVLKGVAKKALPIAANFIAPGVGGAVASAAGQALGLELEGLSPEDQEFEVARRYVRLASEAAKQAAKAPAGAPPHSVAQKAMTIAASKHAPGLLAGAQTGAAGRRKQRGVWQRRGNTIVLHGIS